MATNYNESSREYKYDAFISYKRGDVDEYVANLLLKELESFKLPANVASKLKSVNPNAKTSITRVFKDSAELPSTNSLEDQIVNALKESHFLIVICSPRLKESIWCQKEMETFAAMHGKDNILTVLVDGRSSESIPSFLRERTTQTVDSNGEVITVTEKIEPLAADVRADSNKEIKKKLKSEILRLTAPIFGLSYDELKQRHREQALKRKMRTISIFAGIFLVVAIISSITMITIINQKKSLDRYAKDLDRTNTKLERRNDSLLKDQALFLANESEDYLFNNDRENAILKAYEALTEYDGQKMPYTDEARYALTTSLDPYSYYNSYYMPDFKIDTPGIIIEYQLSPSGETALLYDDTDILTIVSIKEKRIIDQIPFPLDTYNDDILECNIKLINDDTLIYQDTGLIFAYNFREEDIRQLGDGLNVSLYSFFYDEHKNRLILNNIDSLYEYSFDSDKIELLYTIEQPEDPDNFAEILYILPCDDDPDSVYIYYAYNSPPDGSWNFFKCNLETGETSPSYFMGDDYLLFLSDVYESANRLFTYCFVYDQDDDESITNLIRCFDAETGETVWSYSFVTQDASFGKKQRLFVWENRDDSFVHLLALGDYNITELNQTNGDIIDTANINKPIYSSYNLTDDFTYLTFYMSDSTRTRFHNGTLHSSNDALLYNGDKSLRYIDKTCDGYFLCPAQSNTAIFYSSHVNEDNRTTDEKYDISGYYIEDSEAFHYAEDHNIPDYTLVKCIAFDNENRTSRMCVSYRNDLAKVFDISSGELLSEWTLGPYDHYITYYCGEDNEGNTYWASIDYGYCLSKNNKMIARIDALLGIDKDENVMIVGPNDEVNSNYIIPIYSLGELLDMAKEIIDK